MKCSMCGTKDNNEYRFMKFKEDGEIYCEVCASDLAEEEAHIWLEENFKEVK